MSSHIARAQNNINKFKYQLPQTKRKTKEKSPKHASGTLERGIDCPSVPSSQNAVDAARVEL
jgi:hypothetical protein